MFETKGQKWKGKSGRAKEGSKSERAKRELEGKLPPFFAFLLFSMVFFSLFFFLFDKKNMLGENI
jgi:hypothetical protein